MDQKSLAKEIRSAIKNGKIEIVENLIGVNTEAASDGHIEIVKLLLLSGAELDVSEPERNPLIGAIYGGHLDIVKLLVEHGNRHSYFI